MEPGAEMDLFVSLTLFVISSILGNKVFSNEQVWKWSKTKKLYPIIE